MNISWTPVETIPPKKSMPRDEMRPLDGKMKRGVWVRFLDDYLAAGHSQAEATYDPDTYTPDALRSALNATIPRHDRFAGLHVVRRGDSVYVVSGERGWSVNPQTVKDNLIHAEVDGECVVPIEDLDATQRIKLYRAYHYHRTALGLGYLRVSLTEDAIRITDTGRDEE